MASSNVRVVMEPGWQARLGVDLDAMLEHLGPKLVKESRALVRVDTGALRDSIDYEVEDGHLYLSAGEDLDDERALANELGTRHMAAQPYLKPVAMKERQL